MFGLRILFVFAIALFLSYRHLSFAQEAGGFKPNHPGVETPAAPAFSVEKAKSNTPGLDNSTWNQKEKEKNQAIEKLKMECEAKLAKLEAKIKESVQMEKKLKTLEEELARYKGQSSKGVQTTGATAPNPSAINNMAPVNSQTAPTSNTASSNNSGSQSEEDKKYEEEKKQILNKYSQ